MNLTKLFEDVWKLIRHLNRRFSNLGNAPRQSINLGIIILVGFLLWSWVDATFFRSQFEFLAGPQNSTGSVYAKSIIKHFNSTNGTPLRRHKMEGTYSDGFMDNQRQIGKDESGKVVGFGQIGFGDSANTRVLLPLEFNYLHIVCRDGLYDDIVAGHEDWVNKYNANLNANAAEKKKKKVVEKRLGLFELLYVYEKILEEERTEAPVAEASRLERLFGNAQNTPRNRRPSIRPLRIAAGSPGSGTQHLAKKIFNHFDIQFEESGLSSDGAYFLNRSVSVDSTQSMLMNNDVDIVFSLSPGNASSIKRYQHHGFLLDLGEHAGAISQQIADTVLVHTMPDGLYGEPIPRYPIAETGIEIDAPFNNGKWDLWRPRFCEGIQVLKTRRALMCSKYMSSQHGYSIASAAREALGDVIPGIDWENLDKPNQNNRLASVVKFHEGAKLLRDDKSPGFTDWLMSLWEKYRSLLLVTTLTFLLGWLNSKFEEAGTGGTDESDGATAPSPDSPPELEAEQAQTEDLNSGKELEAPVTATEFQTLKSSAFGMTPEEVAYRRLATAIDNQQIELALEDKQLSKNKFRAWQKKLTALDGLITSMKEQGKITAEHEEILRTGYEELNVLFENEFEQKPPVKS